MPAMHLRLLLALLCLLAITACGDAMTRGMVITGDGKVGANTARNQRENAQDALRIAIEEDLGDGSGARVAIKELPIWVEERAMDDGLWRWERITATVEVVAAAGTTLSETKRAELENGARDYLLKKLVKKDAALLTVTLTTGTAAAPVAAPVVQAPGQRTYVVQPGDTLADISAAFYGSPQHWRRIADANPAGTAPGATIVIPAAASAP